jgi:lincosamide nucleotidyltransferase A/C/D/E
MGDGGRQPGSPRERVPSAVAGECWVAVGEGATCWEGVPVHAATDIRRRQGTIAFTAVTVASVDESLQETAHLRGLGDQSDAGLRLTVRDNHGMGEEGMSAEQAASLYHGLRGAGVRCWVIGGWGVDALLRRQTRNHHDLDLLVQVDDLPSLEGWLREEGFRRRYPWDESKPVVVAGQRFETAFVERHEDGRELDIHAVEVDSGCRPRLMTTDPWTLPADTLSAVGVIGSREVACVTSAAQMSMHRGYELPQHHLDDLTTLREELL